MRARQFSVPVPSLEGGGRSHLGERGISCGGPPRRGNSKAAPPRLDNPRDLRRERPVDFPRMIWDTGKRMKKGGSMRLGIALGVLLLAGCAWGEESEYPLKTEDIHIRDPFVVTDTAKGCYYLYASTGMDGV